MRPQGGKLNTRRPFVLLAVALMAVLPTPVAQAEVSTKTEVEFFTGWSSGKSSDPDVVSDLSQGVNSGKGSAPEDLERYLGSPKAAKHITRAADLPVTAEGGGVSVADTPNPVTVNDCRAKFGKDIDKPRYWYPNRFNSCMGAAVEIKWQECRNGVCQKTGSFVYRLILVGHGSKGSNPDGSRTMKFQFFADEGFFLGPKPPPSHELVVHRISCKPSVSGNCAWDHGPDIPEIADLAAGWAGSVRTFTAGNDSELLDHKIYYDLGFQIETVKGKIESPTKQVLRSDRAHYISGGSGAFVFMDVESWFQYSFTEDKDMYYQVKHIWDAHNNIANTKPGDPLTKVAGSRSSNMMLSRLHPDYEPARYDRNNRVAVLTCQQHFGVDYATKKGERECDEYPYRSSHQGAAYSEYEGGHGYWSYSARPIPKRDNAIGGGKLSAFFVRDHIVHGDRYWVDVVGRPDPSVPELEY